MMTDTEIIETIKTIKANTINIIFILSYLKFVLVVRVLLAPDQVSLIDPVSLSIVDVEATVAAVSLFFVKTPDLASPDQRPAVSFALIPYWIVAPCPHDPKLLSVHEVTFPIQPLYCNEPFTYLYI